jgi:hypothetical protein
MKKGKIKIEILKHLAQDVSYLSFKRKRAFKNLALMPTLLLFLSRFDFLWRMRILLIKVKKEIIFMKIWHI